MEIFVGVMVGVVYILTFSFSKSVDDCVFFVCVVCFFRCEMSMLCLVLLSVYVPIYFLARVGAFLTVCYKLFCKCSIL